MPALSLPSIPQNGTAVPLNTNLSASLFERAVDLAYDRLVL